MQCQIANALVAVFLVTIISIAVITVRNRKQGKEPPLLWIFLVACLFVVTVLFVGASFTYTWSPEERGTFGDMFGWANSLFSGLAFAGLLAAILLQRRDLELTKKELRTQTDIFQKQNFENTFFQMLRLHNELLNAIEHSHSVPGGMAVNRGTRLA